MAALKIKKFRNIEEANLLLNGAVYGRAIGPGVDQLVGTTITGTKTFTQGGQYQGRLTFAEIKTQLEAAIANLRVLNLDGRIVFKHATPGTAVTLGAAVEPARALLGLPNNEAVAGVVYNGPGGAAPKLDLFYVQGDTVYAVVEE
jgi:hypothetical protein